MPSGGWGLPLVVLIVGMFMSILDTSIVNVAIPTIQNAFGTTTDEVQWIATSYTLALGVVVPVSAWLSDRFGVKRVYNVSLLLFAAGSALCGLAWSLESMVVFRIIQAHPRRDPAGRDAVDALPDRAAGEDRRRRWGCTASGSSWRRPSAPPWAATWWSTSTGG